MVTCLQLNEAFTATMIFPFAAFMVEDFNVVSRPQDVGFYAGILGAVFFGAQFCTSFLWGRVSDHIGRKLSLILGLIGSTMGMFVFGMSRTYAQAIIGRFMSGALSGNVGARAPSARVRTVGTRVDDFARRVSLACGLGADAPVCRRASYHVWRPRDPASLTRGLAPLRRSPQA